MRTSNILTAPDMQKHIVKIVSSSFLDSEINIPDPGAIFCKIDTEGFEPQVLDALKNSRHWPRVSDIFLEADEGYYNVPALILWLEADGFKIVHQTVPPSPGHYDLHFQRTV